MTKEQEERVRAVGPDSSLRERAGAMYLGYYTIMSYAEAVELTREVQRVLADGGFDDLIHRLVSPPAR
jgi:hypothetical protein